VHALDAGRVHPDLEHRPRLRQLDELLRVELQRQVALRRARGVTLEVVGAQRGGDRRPEGAQDAVVVGAGDLLERLVDLAGECALLGSARGGGERGIEARLEQPGEPGGDAGVPRQHGFHVALAEGQAGLQQVAANCAQHQRLPPDEAGAEHEAVEAVALRLAVPHREERFLEARPGLRRVELAAGRVRHLQVLDPAHGAVVERDAVGTLVQDAQVEVLEQRQQVGHRDRLAAAVQAQLQRARAIAAAAAQLEAEGLRGDGQAEQLEHVGQRLGRRHVGLVGDRERALEAARDLGGARGRQALVDLRAQAVLPGAQRLGNASLDALDAGAHLARGVGAHQQVQARERRLGDLHLRLERLAAELLEQDRLDALAGLGVVAVARHVQQAGEEALVRIAAQQQAHAAPLVQVDDPAERLHEFRHRRLEQFVARVRLEHVHQGLAVVAHRRNAEMVDHALHLVPQQRDRARARAVGGRREQADEPLLARDLAARVAGLHADVVEVRGAVHGRDGVGLGDHECGNLAGLAAHLALQQRRLRARAAAAGAQQAEARARDGDELVGVRAAHQPVFAIAEEGEVVAGEPVDELGGFLRLAGGDAGHALAQVGGDAAGPLHHLRPVVDRHAHVGEGGFDARAKFLELRGVARAVHLDVLPRLGVTTGEVLACGGDAAGTIAPHPEHRVCHGVDGEAAAVQHDRQRIHQERHVVGDHLDDRVGGVPAVVRQVGIEDPHQGLPDLAHRTEAQVAGRRRRQCVRISRPQVGLVHPAVVVLHERAERQRGAAQRACLPGDGVDAVLARGGNGSWHFLVPCGLSRPARIIGQRCRRARGCVCRSAKSGSAPLSAAPAATARLAGGNGTCEGLRACSERAERGVERIARRRIERREQFLLVAERHGRHGPVHGATRSGDREHRAAPVGAREPAPQPPRSEQARDRAAHRDGVHAGALRDLRGRQARVPRQHREHAPLGDAQAETAPVCVGDRAAHEVGEHREPVREEALEVDRAGSGGRHGHRLPWNRLQV
jgi:hypothetical protein